MRSEHARRFDRLRGAFFERSKRLPATRSISWPRSPPGRNSRSSPFSILTIVDSDADGARARVEDQMVSCSPRSASTCGSALSALTLPDVLALGAASGRPKARIRCAGKAFRHADADAVEARRSPAHGSRCSVLSGSTSVSGPGQKASAKARGERVEFGIASRPSARSSHVADQRIEARPSLDPHRCG